MTPADLAATPADWYPDPSGRHQHRYWDGYAWTDHVADAGSAGVDPMPAGGAVGRAVARMQNPDETARRDVVRALEALAGPEATEALVGALGDESASVQRAAAHALSTRQSVAAVGPLMECLGSDDGTLRVEAIRALVMTEAAEAELLALLSGPDVPARDVRFEALAEAVHIGVLDTPRCARVLKQGFRRSWPSPRALQLLGLLVDIKDPAGASLCRLIDANDSAGVVAFASTFGQ